MATLSLAVAGGAPVDLVDALGLIVGTSYIVEVVIGNPSVRLFDGGADAPADLSYYHVVLPGAAGRIGVKPAASTPIWIWSEKPSRLVVTDE